jgi:hypothetical protein
MKKDFGLVDILVVETAVGPTDCKVVEYRGYPRKADGVVCRRGHRW